MKENIKNILIINSGGGLGDAIRFIKIFKILKQNFKNAKIFYYSNDLNKFWFENTLKFLKPRNVYTLRNFPEDFGNNIAHYFSNLLKNHYYDLIIDTQTVLRNTLIYKRIPHKFFCSFACKGIFSKPILYSNNEHIQLRIIEYLEKFLKKKINLKDIKIDIPKKYNDEVKKIIKKNKEYIGLSLKAGHPTRIKEFNIKEIIKTAEYFKKKNFIPAFFVEPKHTKIVKKISKNIQNAFFPEHYANPKLQNPLLLIALGNKMKFNISIDNGAMHALSLSNSKIFCFFNKNAEKFKPISNKAYIYDCKTNNKEINFLKSKEIISFIETSLI